jgi:hypothetical protein
MGKSAFGDKAKLAPFVERCTPAADKALVRFWLYRITWSRSTRTMMYYYGPFVFQEHVPKSQRITDTELLKVYRRTRLPVLKSLLKLESQAALDAAGGGVVT